MIRSSDIFDCVSRYTTVSLHQDLFLSITQPIELCIKENNAMLFYFSINIKIVGVLKTFVFEAD
jgi:hypothetical protein